MIPGLLAQLVAGALRVAFAPSGRRTVGRVERVPDAIMLATAAEYARWANARKWTERRPGTFQGAFRGHPIVFTTGLAGSAPLSPDLVVTAPLDVATPTLFRRGEPAEGPLASLPDALFDAAATVRSVGVTARTVRLTFDKSSDPESFDRALDALDQVFHELASTRAADPYRG